MATIWLTHLVNSLPYKMNIRRRLLCNTWFKVFFSPTDSVAFSRKWEPLFTITSLSALCSFLKAFISNHEIFVSKQGCLGIMTTSGPYIVSHDLQVAL